MPISAESAPALRGCLDTFDRCETILDAISPEAYRGAAPGGYPIGSHLRHILDHFCCFVDGVEKGCVDYDARGRDVVAERDPRHFRTVLRQVRAQLTALSVHDLDRPLKVRQIAALGADPSELETTVHRELVFLSSHTIHHLALVAHLCRSQGIELPDDISLAFSTAAHRQTACQ